MDISKVFKIDRSKLHVYVIRKERTYPIVNGTKVEMTTKTRYEVAPCTADDFDKTDY